MMELNLSDYQMQGPKNSNLVAVLKGAQKSKLSTGLLEDPNDIGLHEENTGIFSVPVDATNLFKN
jgi:putative ubiquitin-RnfH superfamily antitoxin RatB of RatAB toxin-antitoxin module